MHPEKPPCSLRIAPDRLGFDIDGVVADTGGAFLRLLARDYGIASLSLNDINDFEVERCLDLAPELISEVFQRLMEDPVSEKLQPMPEAVSVLDRLAESAPLTFITARPLQEPIDRWLQATLSEKAYARTRLVAMGDHGGKEKFIRDLGLNCFVDDRAETCTALAAGGITSIVFEQPWNQGKHRCPSVNSWTEIHNLLFDD